MERSDYGPVKATIEKLLAGAQGILFDMDGVLIDSEPVHERALQELTARLGRRLTDHRELESFKGVTERVVAKRITELFPHLPHSVGDIVDMKLAIYDEMFGEVCMIAGALDFLRAARESGFRTGLTTSASRSSQQLAWEAFAWHGHFDAVVTGDDVGNGKPHPEPYLKTARLLDLDPRNALVIEDSVNGVLAGKAAGCRVIGITTSFPPDLLHKAGADVVVNDYDILRSAVTASRECCQA